MAVVNSRDAPARPLELWGVSSAAHLRFWGTGAAFVAIYFAINLLTEWHDFDRLGITLWSPDDGLSLALLIESVAFAPFVLLGAVLVDLSVVGVQRHLGVTLTAELFLTGAYVLLAFILKSKLKFDVRQFRLPDVVMFLLLVPACAAVSSVVYCGVLYLGGALPDGKLLVAITHFWIGDALGMITIIPATTAVFTYLDAARWRWSGHSLFTIITFIIGVCLGFAALIGVGDKLYYLFNLLFLPVIWVAMREGYAGVALALVTIQLTLAVVTVFVGYDTTDFAILQLLMLVLSITGLLLGAVATEHRDAALRLREHQRELARMASNAQAGAMGMALAHEVSQPLSTVTTYVHAARRLLLQTSVASAPVMDALIKAEAEAQRAREVLERVRDFVSSGNLSLKALDVSPLADRIAALCREEAAARGVQVAVESMDPVPQVQADGVQIEQVLINLVNNAIDAASERPDGRGQVTIRVADSAGAITIEVDDNGSGVAPELADSIFDAYQTTKPRGMGLGLHLSRRIVERHSGRLWWEPIETGGARFVIELRIDGPNANDA